MNTTKENLTVEQKRALLKKLLLEKKSAKPKPDTGVTSVSPPVKSATIIAEKDYRAFCEFDQFPEIEAFDQQFVMLDQLNIANPYFRVNETITNNRTIIDGKDMISFSSYNYLGLSGDKRVSDAARKAIDDYGTSVSASRVATGEKPLHKELEDEIASLYNTEDSIVFVGGHATNVTVIGHLMRPQDLIVFDDLSHNSIIEGCVLSGARRIPFPHEDFEALDRILQENRKDYERVLITIEGVYSMDGDIANLPAFIEVKKKHNALLFVDEAHSIGVLGKTGKGIREHFDVDPNDVDLWMGTFSKSFASCGGYIAGKKSLINYLKYTTPGFLYSVGISPANAAAALMAAKLIKSEPERTQRLKENAKYFLEQANEAGLNTGKSMDTAVIPIIVGNSNHALLLAHRLFENKINVQPILYPAVPDNESRLRFFITCDHTQEEIQFTVDMTAKLLTQIQEENN